MMAVYLLRRWRALDVERIQPITEPSESKRHDGT